MYDPAAEIKQSLDLIASRYQYLEGRPLVVNLGFDEAACLLRKGGKPTPGCGQEEQYLALRRILSSLRECPVWTFFLSTNSTLEVFASSTPPIVPEGWTELSSK